MIALALVFIALSALCAIAGVVCIIRSGETRGVDDRDAVMEQVATLCYQTGKPVVGRVDDDGRLHIEIIGEEVEVSP